MRPLSIIDVFGVCLSSQIDVLLVNVDFNIRGFWSLVTLRASMLLILEGGALERCGSFDGFFLSLLTFDFISGKGSFSVNKIGVSRSRSVLSPSLLLIVEGKEMRPGC